MIGKNEETDEQDDKGVACLLMPTFALPLLVPNVLVAEIVVNVSVRADRQVPGLVGWIQWRGVEVPLVDFDCFQGEKDLTLAESSARVAVFHAVNDQSNYLFYGIRLSGNPRLVKVMRSQISEESADESLFMGCLVDLDGVEAVLPDLQALEQALTKISEKILKQA